jgi:hypothetical protein
LSIRHVGERFQHSNETISLYFSYSFLFWIVLTLLKIFLQNFYCSIFTAIL